MRGDFERGGFERKIKREKDTDKIDITEGLRSKVEYRNGKLTTEYFETFQNKELIKSITFIVDNSGYSAEYLKKCYCVEFMEILHIVKEKIKAKNQ